MLENNIYPVFSSHYGMNSILTLEPPSKDGEIDNNAPISIFSIAKKYNLDKIIILDKKFGGFIEAYENAEKLDKQLMYGIQFICCANAKDKSEESLKTEHKICIWIKNQKGYKDLCKIYSEVHAKEENFYYIPRIDYNILHDFWSENLILSIPFYDSFLHKNLTTFSACVPHFKSIKPFFHLESHDLPFDHLIGNSVLEYCKNNSFDIINTHQVYYYSSKQFKAFMTYKCILNRSTLDKPELSGFCSDSFSFEKYLDLTTKKE